MFGRFFHGLRIWHRRRKYRPGRTISHFIAKDIRRDIEVTGVSELAAGWVTVRMRTWNLLHAARDIAPKPDFSEPRRVKIEELWRWDGPPWGGRVP